MSSIGVRSNEGSTPLKTRKLTASFASSSVSSQSSPSSAKGFSFITLPRRSNLSVASVPTLSPCTYLTVSLKNKNIKSRIDAFSIEQALYFEPYEESEIDMDLLKALRGGDLDKLRLLEKDEKFDLEARNRFGENLIHMVCRISILKLEVLKFLVEDAKVPFNVRDRNGRTPLHNACMSAAPNFNNVEYLMKKAPKLFVFEDDNSKIPFDLIPHRCYERWTRFLSQKKFLQNLCNELSKHEGLSQNT